uniref:Uncharacterized protein n=1 Tax=Rhizophora mucronata TaxID=61149 RepID=A0A2P2NWX3_RHIMU
MGKRILYMEMEKPREKERRWVCGIYRRGGDP